MFSRLEIRYCLRLLGFMLALLIVSGVSLPLAIISLIAVSLQVVVGVLIWQRLLPGGNGINTKIGVGFAIGSIVAIATDQVLLYTPISIIGDWVFLGLLASFLISRSVKSGDKEQEFDVQLPLMVPICLVLFMFVQERFWPLPIAIGCVLVAIALHGGGEWIAKRRRILVIVSTAVLVALTIWSLQMRTEMWWIKTGDFQFFEGLSYSLAHWGPTDQVFVTGYKVTYHWFSYAWVGMLSKTVGAGHWIVLTKVAPVIALVGIAHLLMSFANQIVHRRRDVLIVCAVVVMLSDFNFESFSMVFSFVWLIAFACVALIFVERPTARLALVVGVFAAAAFGAKSSNAVVIAGVSVALLILGWSKNPRKRNILVLAIAGTAGMSALVFLWLYFGSSYQQELYFGTVGIARDYFGDIRDLTRGDRIIASFVVLANVLVVYLITTLSSMFGIRRNSGTRTIATVGLFTFIATLIALTVLLSPWEQEEYFLHSYSLFGGCIVALVLIGEFHKPKHAGHFVQLVLFAIAVPVSVIAVSRLFSDDNSGTTEAIFRRIIRSSTGLIALVIALLAIAAMKRFSSRSTSLTVLGAVTLSVFVSTTFGLNSQWITKYSENIRETSDKSFADYMVGDTEIREFATQVRGIVPPNDVVASNYFCATGNCKGEIDSQAVLLAVYTQRRFVVTGYAYVWAEFLVNDLPYSPPTELIPRIKPSIEFANEPSARGCAELVDFHARWFIVDKTATSKRTWEPFARSIVETSNFALLKLSQCKN